MKTTFRIASEAEPTEVHTAEELPGLIPCPGPDGLPQAFIVDREDEAQLVGAASATRGFLNYFPPKYDGTRSFSSVDELDREGTFAFSMGGEFSEVPMESTVERQRFELALADFMRNTGLPRAIAWQRD